ncbi:MAG: dihydrofolate reductase [Ignavibacteria bacterium]|jgi:dihydrofolate reductase|nr:dihydrofolate reductase [Ignavibacteria bacterium]MCU7502714.1 dihydrofolate reductase [Ignavibacteria bacterium]MCU7517357.1 dihydrofolate reductase [Ignavibacteria bacterium]
MSTCVYVAASLDGFIAKKDGNIDWLIDLPNPDGSDFGFNEFMKEIDAVIMGRNTFEKVLSMNTWIYTKHVFVLSNKLKEIPRELHGKAEIIRGYPKTVLCKLEDRGYCNFYVDGGITIQNFLKDDLIDELIISTIPILLGEGIPLFGNIHRELKFEYVKTEVLNNIIIKNFYKRVRK